MATEKTIKQMCAKVFGHDDFSANFSEVNSNYFLTMGNGLKIILQISNDKKTLQKHYEIAQKLWRKMPVIRALSQVLEADNGQYFIFFEAQNGNNLSNLLKISPTDQAQLGYEMGEYLGLLHSQKLAQKGMFLPPKKIKHPESWEHHNCLVHTSLAPDNIFHHQGHISAITQWQNAQSGHPTQDFKAFTQAPYNECPIFVNNLCDAYYLRHKNLPKNWVELASLP